MWQAAKSFTSVMLPSAVKNGFMLSIPNWFSKAHFPCNKTSAPRYSWCKAADGYGPRACSLGCSSRMG